MKEISGSSPNGAILEQISLHALPFTVMFTRESRRIWVWVVRKIPSIPTRSTLCLILSVPTPPSTDHCYSLCCCFSSTLPLLRAPPSCLSSTCMTSSSSSSLCIVELLLACGPPSQRRPTASSTIPSPPRRLRDGQVRLRSKQGAHVAAV